MVPTFYHSGEIGDILYGLKVLSRMPKVNFYTHPSLQLDWSNLLFAHSNKQISYRDFMFIKPLLDRQPYINESAYTIPSHIDYNLNYFRHVIFDRNDVNFSDLYLEVCNIKSDRDDCYTPWLFCDIKKEYPITAIRVSRRTNDSFPWKQIVNKYKNDILFLGTKSEYLDFVEYTGKLVAWNDYTNLLSICEVINGAKLHIGNSTSISVCAEGLKKPMIFEESHDIKHVRYHTHRFYRNNRLNVGPEDNDADVIMEKISTFIGT
jgi:hypothetical protein